MSFRHRSARVFRLLFLLVVVVPVAAWFVVRPVRVLMPAYAGVSCHEDLCTDDPARRDEALQLKTGAAGFVSQALLPLSKNPRIVFCSTRQCADSFGLGARSAVTLGTWGTVIGPRAWKPYYVRHELIHQLQAQQLGVLSLLLKPKWFVEGMAYGLSEDPRHPLAEPFEGQRLEFLDWYAKVGRTDVWSAAEKI